MAQLLVSVRSEEEAAAALRGGARLIDVKEPANGALGRAPAATLSAVLEVVARRCPVSAALGELLETPVAPPVAGLAYVKWGLAGCGPVADWPCRLTKAASALQSHPNACQLVAVAYADWQRASAPPPEDVHAYAAAHSCGAMLVDTWQKDGTTLLDWLSFAEIQRLVRSCGVPVALAGSLGQAEIRRLRSARPHWFAVRGAACYRGRRDQAIDPNAVRRLAQAATGRVMVASSAN